MGAPKGNRFWELRSKHGRDKLFATPELMWEAACEYFEWCEENPLMKEEGFAFQGMVTHEEFPLMRAMTLSGLCFYLNCNEQYFGNFKRQLPADDKDFSRVIHDIEAVIYNQKFAGAAAGLLKENIIARELGIADKQEFTGIPMINTPIQINVMDTGYKIAQSEDEIKLLEENINQKD
jgi:hypothetical protein